VKLCLDPGHGGRDSGARAFGKYEKDTNLAVSLKLRERLCDVAGLKVFMTRSSDTWLSIDDRAHIANEARADALVSIHADWASGPGPRGHHAIYSIHSRVRKGGHLLARMLVDELTTATGRPYFNRSGSDRGCWTRESQSSPGRDWYGIIRKTAMPAVICERGFLTNPEDLSLLFDDSFLDQQAQGMAQAVLQYFGLATAKTPILGPASATVKQAQAWARARGAADVFIDLAGLYWELAPILNIRPEVGYAQAAKETAFGRFGGVIDRAFHNWCGLKTAKGGANSDPDAHACFPDDRTGVLAHLQHLALYAGAPVTGEIVDPRHFSFIEGTARTVEDLGGRWAPAADYGLSIVRDYLRPLMETRVEDRAVPREEYERVVAERDAAREKLERIREILS